MTSRIGRIFWLAVVLLSLVACAGDSTVEDFPLLAERDFASTWFEVGADKITKLQDFNPHVFCPVRGPQSGQWAVAEDVEMTDQWTTELVLRRSCALATALSKSCPF